MDVQTLYLVVPLAPLLGAIVLTLRHRVGVRRQRIGDQLARTRAEAVAVVKVPLGVGAAPASLGEPGE